MKKITAIAFVAAAVFACSRKTVVTTETKTKTENAVAETKVKTETVAPVVEDKAHADIPSAEMLATGKTIYTTKCARCHAAKEVTAYTEQRWEPILKSMIPKARLDDAEAKQVTTYVMANAKK